MAEISQGDLKKAYDAFINQIYLRIHSGDRFLTFAEAKTELIEEKEKIDQLESDFLNLPQLALQDLRQSQGSPNQKVALVTERQLKEMKEAREEFIEGYIRENTKKWLDQFEPFLAEAVNGREARELIETKTRAAYLSMPDVKKFIEFDGGPHFVGIGKVLLFWAKTEDGQQYIAKFDTSELGNNCF
jgi:hypothetical protein